MTRILSEISRSLSRKGSSNVQPSKPPRDHPSWSHAPSPLPILIRAEMRKETKITIPRKIKTPPPRIIQAPSRKLRLQLSIIVCLSVQARKAGVQRSHSLIEASRAKMLPSAIQSRSRERTIQTWSSWIRPLICLKKEKREKIPKEKAGTALGALSSPNDLTLEATALCEGHLSPRS